MPVQTCTHTSFGSDRTPRDHARPPVLGIIGGGQLARLLALAARQLDCDVVVLNASADCPAAALASRTIVADDNDIAALHALAA